MIEYVSDTGEDFTEDSSDCYSDGPISRHHLLRHKLILDEGTSSNKDAPKSKEGKRERKRGARKENQSCKNNLDSDQMEQEMSISSDFDFCEADSESEADSDELDEDAGMSEELSESGDEADEDKLKKYVYFNFHW